MPDLDRSRFVEAVPADPSHKIPMPDRGGRFMIDEGETVDLYDPFYASLFGDGSLKLKPAATEPPAEKPKTDPAPPAPKVVKTDADASAKP